MTRRREAELAALFETASELAGMRDPDAVLRSIVRRARTLLGTDVSYLSMNDPVSTYMRVTDGSFSPLFQKVRLGLGEGLGGLVAQTARPYATADYFADARFNHTNPIDSAVHDEGLTAILGVPLKLDSKVIGVLYAADRTSREFPAEEVALLQSLADHAAIAIDTASLFATIQSHNEAMKRAEEAHDRLTDLVLRGGSSADVAAAVGELLGGQVEVLDTVPTCGGAGQRTGRAARRRLGVRGAGRIGTSGRHRADRVPGPAERRSCGCSSARPW